MSPTGPLGGPRPFARDNKRVLVLVGIDGTEPPNHIQIDLETSIQMDINDKLDVPPATYSVNLTTNSRPTEDQRRELGPSLIHVQQYEVETPWKEITQKQINAVHNDVVDKLNELGFNITGTKTTVI